MLHGEGEQIVVFIEASWANTGYSAGTRGSDWGKLVLFLGHVFVRVYSWIV